MKYVSKTNGLRYIVINIHVYMFGFHAASIYSEYVGLTSYIDHTILTTQALSQVDHNLITSLFNSRRMIHGDCSVINDIAHAPFQIT